MLYLDCNATSMMPKEVIEEYVKWCNQGNAAAGYASANRAAAMLEAFKQEIAAGCGFILSSDATDNPTENHYRVVFTSCASESNATIIRTVASAYRAATQRRPHIIVSSIEHKSILNTVNSMVDEGACEIACVKPTISGHILPAMVAREITPNTCLVCIMHANNETGAINDIAEIGRICHSMSVVFYSDTVQTFGKMKPNPIKNNLDAFCATFHKYHGPTGIGALIIKEQFLRGFQIKALIGGTQNNGLRGGTDNISSAAAAAAGLRFTWTARSAKNARIAAVKEFIMVELSRRMPACSYSSYIAKCGEKSAQLPAVELVFLSGNEFYLVNTILLSVVKRTLPLICNVKLKKSLETAGVIVSIGSACNTKSAAASHVLTELKCDDYIKKGTLRVSLCDDITIEAAKKFILAFLQIIVSLV